MSFCYQCKKANVKKGLKDFKLTVEQVKRGRLYCNPTPYSTRTPKALQNACEEFEPCSGEEKKIREEYLQEKVFKGIDLKLLASQA